ncbi:Uu.00g106040.m01.CDS01 [Anthostomella pinea]|uniref:Uu.00g106040.m01.CDS01 n=1 Tax=Anthostomella pinea TaxID=933095 RepID=A0AAI8YFZ7_9PEZI|nr:Uu.00g106040.m01.CDS01 [Anthostomella pinea]
MPVARFESAPVDVSPLGQPMKFEFSGKVAKNRFLKAAMAEDLATWSATNLEERGAPTKELIELWGEGEWGVISTGNIDINFDMLSAVGDMIITPECGSSGPRFEAFQELAKGAKAHGSLLVAQMTHPGRQLLAKIRKDTISASAIQHGEPTSYYVMQRITPSPGFGAYAVPREATKAEIASVVEGFAYAAEYLQKAGFDGVKLHGAHGYLISQFLSEQSNKRTDEYGGTLANRMRIVVEIAEAIKARVQPGFILAIKMNSVEFQEKGLDPEEVKIICEMLQTLGFDFVDLSGGNHADIGYGGERESTRKREAYFIDFVKDIVPHLTTTKKFLVGGFRSAASMVEALDSLDGIALGRPAAQEPRFPVDLLAGKITGAIKSPKEFGDDLWLSLAAAGCQMRQVGQGREPFDSSNEKAAAAFKVKLDEHIAKLMADGDKLEMNGFPDLTAPETSARAYGDAY